MIKIAICEDCAVQQRNLQAMVKRWSADRGREAESFVYETAEAFWFAWSDRMDFDVLLLDIDLGRGRMNGMELARQIRTRDLRLEILFITGFSQYMAEGYDVRAIHFLVKPVEQKRLWEILDRASGRDKPEESIVLEGKEQTLCLALSDLLYAEAFSHTTVIASKDGHQIELAQDLKELEQKLPEKQFVRCHRSYLVNLRQIERITKQEVFLTNGRVLPVSRRREKELLAAFLAYHRGRRQV